MQKTSFTAFYQSIHHYPPFPWQIRLAQQVARGQWPDALNLPTSSGKTAVLDVWLWAHSAGVQGVPRRLYYVIDRRLLVDAVADYAQDLFARSGMAGAVVRLRGGMGAAEDAWMLNPGGLTVISTTLDQIGSRLLCRAYGCSRWTAPVHAGLVGNDALIVIDEAHLVEPFRQTLGRIAHFRRKAVAPLQLPWHVLTMTATPASGAADVLVLDAEDRAHPLLLRRLSARMRPGTGWSTVPAKLPSWARWWARWWIWALRRSWICRPSRCCVRRCWGGRIWLCCSTRHWIWTSAPICMARSVQPKNGS